MCACVAVLFEQIIHIPVWSMVWAWLPCRSDDGARTCRLPLTHNPPAFYSCFSWTYLHLFLNPPGLSSRKQQQQKLILCPPPPAIAPKLTPVCRPWGKIALTHRYSALRSLVPQQIRAVFLEKRGLFIQRGAGSWWGEKPNISLMTRTVSVSAYERCIFTQFRPPGLRVIAPPMSPLLRFPLSCHGSGRKGSRARLITGQYKHRAAHLCKITQPFGYHAGKTRKWVFTGRMTQTSCSREEIRSKPSTGTSLNKYEWCINSIACAILLTKC